MKNIGSSDMEKSGSEEIPKGTEFRFYYITCETGDETP